MFYRLIFLLTLIGFANAGQRRKSPEKRGTSGDLQITVYPHELTVREGKEAYFECRARISNNVGIYPEVRWSRVGGPLSSHKSTQIQNLPEIAHESHGKLTFNPASLGHSGRYVCIATHNGRTVEAYATLNVLSYGPQEYQQSGTLRDGASAGCMPGERACGDNECIKADYVCDGEPDCRDRSDEQNCPPKRHCEPNEFRCRNDKCIQKMWLCDGDDDCGDNSDEQNCGTRRPGDLCQPTEFKCNDGRQCVPQSFQCDGTNDCADGSDEVGCTQPTVVQPPDSNKVVPAGTDFKLTCRAVGVPDPYINWRLNWGPVCEPPRCQQQSEGGVGSLTVQNAQPMDQGAYTCEAINVKGRVLATPDCIVRIVSIPAPTAPPAEVRQLTCHATGAYTPYPDTGGQCQCKPEVEGPTCGACRPGAYHLSEGAPQGCLKCFCFGITDQCRSSYLFRTKEKLFVAGDAQGIELTDINQQSQPGAVFDFEQYGFLTHKEPHFSQTLYWKLPQRFLGDKVTAYGGMLSVELQYEGSGQIRDQPLVVLKGNGITLTHKPRDQESVFTPGRPFKVEIPTFETNYVHLTGGPSSREDLMMVLADLDMFLIRATHTDDQRSTSLGEVSLEIAVEKDTQDVRALEVEHCECPPGYTGYSCEDCAPGYERAPGPYLGKCVPARRPPPPQCSAIGAVSPQPGVDGRCHCKANIVGASCDRCAPESFNLAQTSPQGCLRCFCSGVTHKCESSALFRSAIELDYSRGSQDQLEATTSDLRSPYHPPTQPQVYDSAINFNGFYEARGQTLYWKLPSQFLGNKITSYGGNLRYKFRFSGSGQMNTEPDVIIHGNGITLNYKSPQTTVADRENTVEIVMYEQNWVRSDGLPATREHLLMALADLETVLIKMSYMSECSSSSLISVSLDVATPHGTGPRALEVEQCDCPPGYVGTSCEDCAVGYSRISGGHYLGLCQKCECYGHATSCDSEYGVCLDCQHNTEGDHCERCRPGFVGDARRGTPYDCVRQPPPVQPAQRPCQCYNHSPRGCDSFGRCLLCEHNTEGYHCEACKRGFYGDATKGTPYDCTPCPCPGQSECFLDPSGQVQCRNCPAGYAGRLCNECAPGYTKSQKSGGRECEPIGRHLEDITKFVDEPEVPFRVDILHPKHLSVNEGGRAKWICKVVSALKPDEVELSWMKIGSDELPSHSQQHGTPGQLTLVIDSVKHTDIGQYRCTGQFKADISTDEATLTIVAATIPPPVVEPVPAPPVPVPVPAPAHVTRYEYPKPAPAPPAHYQYEYPRPVVTPPHQIVDENAQAIFTCLTPGYADCEVEWYFQQLDGPLPAGAHRRGNQLFIPIVQSHHVGDYYCSVFHTQGRADSNPGRLEIRKGPLRPMVDPPQIDVYVGEPARFRCWVPGVPHAVLKWRPASGASLPSGADQRDGYLDFPRTVQEHRGQYICAAYDPKDDPTGASTVDSTPVLLNVRRKEQQPPQVDPLVQQVDLGEPARFRCWVPGEPDAKLTWSTYHGGPLPTGANQKDGYLIFDSVGKADAGGYVCSVADKETGAPINSPVARLIVNEPKKPMRPLVDPPEQIVDYGSPARIRCWVPGYPHAHLRWNRRGGQPLPPGAQDDGRGNLYIHRTLDEHQGDYECTAQDPQEPSRAPEVSEPARISLNRPAPPPPEHPPKIHGDPPRPVATPPVLNVRRGEPARFHCEPNSAVPAEIYWGFEHEKGALPEGVEHDDKIISIDSVDDSHEGEYICSATNEFGHGRAEPVKLVIVEERQPPTARVEPKTWEGRPGDKHEFRCYATGSPPLTIKWTGPDGASLPDDVIDLGEGILEISNANKKKHDGMYTCKVSNDVGSASDSGVVAINSDIIINITPPGPRLVFHVGDAVSIKCEAIGEPDPEVEWLIDPGPERGDLPEGFVPVTISEQFIKHPSIGLGNAGRYTCRAKNEFAVLTKDIYIDVIEPSGVATVSILGGNNQWLIVGQTAELTCAPSGSTLIDRVEWTSSSGKLQSEVTDNEGVLRFEPFKASHEGEYECNAYRKDNVIATSRVNVFADTTVKPDLIHVEIAPPSVRIVEQGDSIVLDCVVHGRHSDEFTYVWSLARGGALIRDLGKQNQLVIKSVDPSNDYGIYRCEVENENGDSVGSAQTAVSVGYASSDNALDAQFDEDDEAILTCPVFSIPGATVTWEKEDGELPEDSRPVGHKLSIVKFDDSSSGIYKCSVEYGQRTIHGYVNAKILVPTTTIKVQLNVSSEILQIGDRAWLDCIVTGDDTAKIEFSKEGTDELPQNAQVTGNRLTFTSIKEEDAGRYKCRAFTSEGTLETTANLNVEESSSGEEKRRRHLSNFYEKEIKNNEVSLSKSESNHVASFGPRYSLAHLPADSDEFEFMPRRVRKLKHQRRRALHRNGPRRSHPKKTHPEKEQKHKKSEVKEFAKPNLDSEQNIKTHKQNPTVQAEMNQQNRREQRYKNVQYTKYYHHYDIKPDAPTFRRSVFSQLFSFL